jgi:hypothetical protein
MGMQEFRAAVALMDQSPSLQHFVGRRDEALGQKAEEALGLRFPPSYREFVLTFGAGSFGGTEIYGVIREEFQNSMVPNGIWLTLKYRGTYGMPKPFIIICDDDLGSYFAIDTRRVDEQGESPVVILPVRIDETAGEQELEVDAPDFGSFLLKMVREEIEFWASME